MMTYSEVILEQLGIRIVHEIGDMSGNHGKILPKPKKSL